MYVGTGWCDRVRRRNGVAMAGRIRQRPPSRRRSRALASHSKKRDTRRALEMLEARERATGHSALLAAWLAVKVRLQR